MIYNAEMPAPVPDVVSPARHLPVGDLLPIVRRLLMLVLWFGLVGITADLLLLDHVESWTQRIPLVAIAVAALALVGVTISSSTASRRLLQIAMLMLIITGGLGVYLHYQGNAEFQTEIDPSLHGMKLFWMVMRAKAPPALAPAAMVQLGLVGLVLGLTLSPVRRGLRILPESGAMS